MGTISHHQAKAREFLRRADRAIATRDPAATAAALRRAATHMTTALAVHQGWRHKSQRQLETVLHANVACDNLSRSHLKTLRHVHTMSQQADSPTQSSRPNGSDHPGASCGTGPPLADRCKNDVRRMRRRVAALISHALALIAGRPTRVVHHKLWQRAWEKTFRIKLPDPLHLTC